MSQPELDFAALPTFKKLLCSCTLYTPSSKSNAAKSKSPALKRSRPSKSTSSQKLPNAALEMTKEDRERMIQYAAYHIAEKDGFKPGKEQEYWFQAEKQISDLMGNTSQEGSSVRAH